MKNISMNDGSIYFLNFTFDIKMRVLQRDDEIVRLRKKEADVLELLCHKYPKPVSQDDFLMEVWRGGYVTSQSIAQVIRSLRRSLEDKDKSIIITIPKLGYQLAVPPSFCMKDFNVVEMEQNNSVWENNEPDVFDNNSYPITGPIFPFFSTQYLLRDFFSKRKLLSKMGIMLCGGSMIFFIVSLFLASLHVREGMFTLGEERSNENIMQSENTPYSGVRDLFFCSKDDENVTCYSNERNSIYTWNNY